MPVAASLLLSAHAVYNSLIVQGAADVSFVGRVGEHG